MGNDPDLDDFLKSLGVDDQKGSEQSVVADNEAVNFVATTSESVVLPGMAVARHFGMVSSTRSVGQNAWKDFLASVRDFVGGRSKTVESTLVAMEREILGELKAMSLRRGANAMVATRVQFGEISGGAAGMMFYATGHATPVLMVHVESQKG